MRNLFLISAFAMLVSCQKIDLQQGTLGIIGCETNPDECFQTLHFSSEQALKDAIAEEYSNTSTKSAPGFISYYETVMSEPYYDEQPWALYCENFGRILNPDGEVIFGETLLKVTEKGILLAPISMTETIRALAADNNLLSKCTTKEICEYVPDHSPLYKVDGYQGVYLGDTFNMLSENNKIAPIETKSSSNVDVKIFRRNASLFAAFGPMGDGGANWNSTFTVPPSGDQKRKFSDGKHCNDTKVFHQDFIVGTDTGLRTKNMKKRSLGYWDAIDGQIEAGIIGTFIWETVGYSAHINQSTPASYNNVSYAGKTYTVKTVRSNLSSVLSKSNATLVSEIASANSYLSSIGSTATVTAIRYIINDSEAITRIPDLVVAKESDSKLNLNFLMKFGGMCMTGASLINGTGIPGANERYHIMAQTLYGVSIRGDEMRGSKVIYEYNGSIEN